MNDSNLDEFAAAAILPHQDAQGGDVIERIASFGKFAAQEIQGLSDRARLISTRRKRDFEDDFGFEVSISSYGRRDIHGELFAYLGRLITCKVLRPMCVKADEAIILREACEVRRELDVSLENIMNISAQKLRASIERHVGDARETSIRQLKDEFMRLFYHRYSFAEGRGCFRANLFERETGNYLRHTCSSKDTQDFELLAKYLIHLATGSAPSEIKVPPVPGFGDGHKRWLASDIFRRYSKPWAGTKWIRFMAEGSVQFEVETAIADRITAHILTYPRS